MGRGKAMSAVAAIVGMTAELVMDVWKIVKRSTNLNSEEIWDEFIESAERFHGKVDSMQARDIAEYERRRGPR
jgi:hypothetical protein